MTDQSTRPRATQRRVRRVAALALAVLLVKIGVAFAHGALSRSEPASGAKLTVAPARLLLEFNERTDLNASRVALVAPDSTEVELSTLVHPGDSSRVIVANIIGALRAGDYTVRWQTTGRDGHPVRGTFAFAIQPGAAGLAADAPVVVAPPPGQGHTSMPPAEPPFDASSPAFAAIRWAGYLGLLGAIGAVMFRLFIVGRLSSPFHDEVSDLLPTFAQRARQIGIASSILLVLVAGARIAAQTVAVIGSMDVAMMSSLVTGTAWGMAWICQGVALLALVGGLLFVGRDEKQGWGIAAVAVVGLALTQPLFGHAAAAPRLELLAVFSDGVHIVSAGGWLGTLLLVVFVGIPTTYELHPRSQGAAVRALIDAFSPLALVFAGAIAATGLFASWMNLDAPSDLVRTDYGRTLLIKLGLLAVVAAFGLYNWRRLTHRLGNDGSTRQLRRSATVELALGALVLAVTAVLVATPLPSEGDTAAGVQTTADAGR